MSTSPSHRLTVPQARLMNADNEFEHDCWDNDDNPSSFSRLEREAIRAYGLEDTHINA